MKYEYNGERVKLDPKVKKYLKTVARKLRLPKEIKESVMSDLLTGIYARIEGGESIETVLKQMGTPLQVAEGINMEMDDVAYTKSPWRWACLVLIILSAAVLLMQGATGVLLLLANGAFSSIGVIGGVDGPAQIYVTTTPGAEIHSIVMAAILLVMGILGFCRLSRCQKKQE